MHKCRGNAIWFDDAANKIGADVMRWIFCLQNPTAHVNFGWKATDETRRRLLKLWDSYKFFVLYAVAEQWRPGDPKARPARTELDRWLMSRLNTLVATVRERLDDFDAMNASRAVEGFFDDLSNWYIRRSRARYCSIRLHRSSSEAGVTVSDDGPDISNTAAALGAQQSQQPVVANFGACVERLRHRRQQDQQSLHFTSLHVTQAALRGTPRALPARCAPTRSPGSA